MAKVLVAVAILLLIASIFTEGLYIILLVVGGGFLLVTLFVGEFIEIEGTTFPLMRPSLLAAFLTIAGAVGTFMGDTISRLFLFPAAFIVALAISLLLNKLVIEPLHRAQNTSTVSREEIVGTVATVDSRIAQGGFGRIVYAVGGSRVTSTARAVDDSGFNADTAVEIVRIDEDGTCFVKKATQPVSETPEEIIDIQRQQKI